MYDGFYIYSPYKNVKEKNTSYDNDSKVTDLKPYIQYSCRYKKGSCDVVITYSLDNYISIRGKIGDKGINESGYLLENVTDSGGTIGYKNIPIRTERLSEINAVYDENGATTEKPKEYPYIKINGVKYYQNDDGSWFSILNGVKTNLIDEKYKGGRSGAENNEGQLYYKEARDFTNRIMNGDLSEIGNLKVTDAVNYKGIDKGSNERIFDTSNIEYPNSNFNQHRLAVIRYSIEKNLSIAISNYNKISDNGVSANFQMPKLNEDEWTKIENNVSVISFLQGLSIGGKVYNGYSVVANTSTEEVVNTDSIYIQDNDEYHRVTEDGLRNANGAYLYTDYLRKSVITQDGSTIYFYPQRQTASYDSVVTQNKISLNFYKKDKADGNIYNYVTDSRYCDPNIASIYLTALGRERWSMYKTNNINEDLKKEMQIDS